MGSGLVGHVPVASRPGQLGPGWEVALGIQVAQIWIRCLWEQEIKIWGGAQNTPPLTPQGLG